MSRGVVTEPVRQLPLPGVAPEPSDNGRSSKRQSGRDDSDRAARIGAIQDGARVRQAVGQAAQHHRRADGQHEVSIFDHEAGRLCTFVAETLDGAIAKARRG